MHFGRQGVRSDLDITAAAGRDKLVQRTKAELEGDDFARWFHHLDKQPGLFLEQVRHLGVPGELFNHARECQPLSEGASCCEGNGVRSCARCPESGG